MACSLTRRPRAKWQTQCLNSGGQTAGDTKTQTSGPVWPAPASPVTLSDHFPIWTWEARSQRILPQLRGEGPLAGHFLWARHWGPAGHRRGQRSLPAGRTLVEWQKDTGWG